MPLYIYNNGLLVRSDGLASSESCCCDAPGCCCVSNTPDPTKATEAACVAAGGVWRAGVPCDQYQQYDCRCCEVFKYLCREEVFGRGTWNDYPPAGFESPPIGPQPPGTVLVDMSPLYCADSDVELLRPGPYGDWSCETGLLATPPYETPTRYVRYRVVDSCSDCTTPPKELGEFCPDRAISTNCWAWDQLHISMQQLLCECNVTNLCDNPLP